MIENVAAAVPRMERMRKATGAGVCIGFELWLHKHGEPAVSEWSVYVTKTSKSYEGATLEQALAAAERECGVAPFLVPDAIETPSTVGRVGEDGPEGIPQGDSLHG